MTDPDAAFVIVAAVAEDAASGCRFVSRRHHDAVPSNIPASNRLKPGFARQSAAHCLSNRMPFLATVKHCNARKFRQDNNFSLARQVSPPPPQKKAIVAHNWIAMRPISFLRNRERWPAPCGGYAQDPPGGASGGGAAARPAVSPATSHFDRPSCRRSTIPGGSTSVDRGGALVLLLVTCAVRVAVDAARETDVAGTGDLFADAPRQKRPAVHHLQNSFDDA